MKTRMRMIATTVLACGVMLSALATPKMQPLFNRTYPVGKDSDVAKAKCAVCHVKGKELNAYGKDIEKEMQARKTKDLTVEILRAVEKLDSDKDGASNGDELKAGTLPGDPKSKPAS